MSGLLSGLGALGLDNLEKMDLFEKEDKKDSETGTKFMGVSVPKEEEFIYDKQFDCPVCGGKITSKVAKSGKAKLISADLDLRPQYEYFDSSKYDTVVCEECGYASLYRYHGMITSGQAKAIHDIISKKVTVPKIHSATYSYEQALERYKLTLANAVVKKAKNSEKAYICLKMSWLLRGYLESGELDKDAEKKKQMKDMEQESLRNAYKGFLDARQAEGFPMCGMDEQTVDYLIGALAYELGELEMSARMVQTILLSANASKRVRDKAYHLKELIIESKKKA